MVITPQIKERVVGALLSDMEQRGFKSQADYAKFIVGQLDIAFDKAAFSQIKKPEGRNAIKDSSWLRLARHFNVLDNHRWNKADTATFKIVTGAITLCKKRGVWQVLCDNAGVGKTYAAKYFAETHKHSAVYIDCSQSLTKSEFILEAARQLGLERTSTYARLWREVTDALLLMEEPILILDEFGDVHDSVITLLKSLYNKADMGDHLALSVYMIGADNLRKRLTDGRKNKKQSYAEFWSRFDNNITTLNFDPKPSVYLEQLREEVCLIVDANLPMELADKREQIIDKTLKTGGVRAVRKNIGLQLSINYLNAV